MKKRNTSKTVTGFLSNSRRTFMRGCVATAGLSLLNLPTVARASAIKGGASIIAIYDDRFSQARAFCSGFKHSDFDSHSLNDGLTDLWFKVLEPELQRTSTVVLGMTTSRTLVGIEQLMTSYRMRVAVRMGIDVERNLHAVPARFLEIVSDVCETRRYSHINDICTSECSSGDNGLVAWMARPTLKNSVLAS